MSRNYSEPRVVTVSKISFPVSNWPRDAAKDLFWELYQLGDVESTRHPPGLMTLEFRKKPSSTMIERAREAFGRIAQQRYPACSISDEALAIIRRRRDKFKDAASTDTQLAPEMAAEYDSLLQEIEFGRSGADLDSADTAAGS
jgi:hypothetical protein